MTAAAKCSRCGIVGGPEAFYTCTRMRSGLSSWCRNCTQEANAKWKDKRRSKHGEDKRKKNSAGNGLRVCVRCGVVGGTEKFNRGGNHSTGLSSMCKKCISAATRAKKYGNIEGLLGTEVCEICGTNVAWSREASVRSVACIDHCHETGRVRGVLCSRCNAALGLLDDEPCRLRAAADYIERFVSDSTPNTL